MLEGLEISEISIQDIFKLEDYRLEAEFHISKRVKFDSVKGVDVESFSQYGTSKDLNENHIGFPVLRLNEFDSFFISKPAKHCDLIDTETYKSLKLKKDDVLICRTNGNPKLVGKAAIVPQDYEYAFASYLFRIRPDINIINSATLVAFLNSRYGRLEIEKYSMVGNQANFSPAKFRQISVPIFSKQFNVEVEKLVYKSFNLLEESKKHYWDAVEILNSELGLKDWQPNNAPVNIKQLKESFLTSGRLDAEYYQPKYDEIENIIKNYKNGTEVIGDLFTQNTEVCDFKEEAYNYIEIGDINISDGTANYNLISKEELPDNAKRVLHKNDILISKVRPYRGAVSIIDFDDDKLIGSGAFTVLHEKTTYKKEVLQILLRTQVYRDWLLKWNVGSSYPVIKDEDILRLPIPLIPQNIQIEIAEYVQNSISLRNEAKQLLENAKMMVEREIEKGGL